MAQRVSNPRPFASRVVVEMGEPLRLHSVGSVREAAEALLEWPEAGREGPAFQIAATACREALSSTPRRPPWTRKTAVAKARNAFIAAAKEAGIFVRAEPGKRRARKRRGI